MRSNSDTKKKEKKERENQKYLYIFVSTYTSFSQQVFSITPATRRQLWLTITQSNRTAGCQSLARFLCYKHTLMYVCLHACIWCGLLTTVGVRVCWSSATTTTTTKTNNKKNRVKIPIIMISFVAYWLRSQWKQQQQKGAAKKSAEKSINKKPVDVAHWSAKKGRNQ